MNGNAAIDLLGGYLLSRRFSRWSVLAPLAVLVGVFSSLASNFALYLAYPGLMSAREAATQAVSGFFWHPLLCLLATWYFLRRQNVRPADRGEDSEPD